jgi:SAM-dependent methyltransferase
MISCYSIGRAPKARSQTAMRRILRAVHQVAVALGLKVRLGLKRGRTVAFDLPSIGELQFIGPVLLRYAGRNPDDLVLIVHNGETIEEFNRVVPSLKSRVVHVRRSLLNRFAFPEIDLFITSEQYDLGLDGVYSITMFHGQAAKGLSFVPDVIETFDALFLNGPVHREAFEVFVSEFLSGKPPPLLELFEIGYPKSDDLLNGRYTAKDTLKSLMLDQSKKTVLYAPAFNEGASLREYGIETIELLAQEANFNIIVKLPIECSEPSSNIYATGGINWFGKIRELEAKFSNLRLYSDYQIDSLLACADVLVTCISSVGFEFLALNRPVVFIDTPKYFSGYLQRRFPDKDTVSWASRTTVNGGREFGLVVSDIHELPDTIRTVLARPEEFPRQQERLKHYLLFNRGRGTEAAVAKIEELLRKGAKSRRTSTKHGIFRTVLAGVIRLLAGSCAILLKDLLIRFLHARGYTLQKTGLGFVDAKSTIAAARQKGLSVCEYREALEDDPRKKGRRDLIISKLKDAGLLDGISTVCEIGAGTGQYLEKVMALAQLETYEVYETDPGWVKFLESEYGWRNGCTLICRPADGKTLRYTPSGSIDLVHAHGVFVYLPLLQTMEYLKECMRVLRPGGHIVFDVYLDTTFSSLPVVEQWLAGPHRFPVVIPGKLLEDFACIYGLRTVEAFSMIHGSGTVDYLIWQKAAGCP